MAYDQNDPLGLESGGPVLDDPLGINSTSQKIASDENDPLGINAPQAQVPPARIPSNFPPPAPAADVQPQPVLKNPDIIAALPETPSTVGAFARGAARNVLPTAGFIAAAPVGRALGAAAGARTGALLGALVPGLGETGVSEGVGAVIGGLIGMFGAGTAAATGVKALQTGAADAIAPDSLLGTKSEQADVAAHPIASELGSLAVIGRPNPFNIIRAARTIGSDTGRAALTDLLKSGATKDGYETWAKTYSPEAQKSAMNVLNVAQAGGINAAFNAYDQVRSGNYSFPTLLRSAAEGALFNEPWIQAKNPATKAFDDAVNPQPTDKNASQVTSSESISQPEIRPPVGQSQPLRQQGEAAGTLQQAPPSAGSEAIGAKLALTPTTIIKGVVAKPVGPDTHIIQVGGQDAAILRHVGGDEFNAAQQSVGATGWEGYFIKKNPDGGNPTIYINKNFVDSNGPIFTHETTHLLDAMGLITPEQMDSVVKKYGGDIAPEVTQRYFDFNAKNNLPPPKADDIQREIFANVFQNWHEDNNAPKIGWIQKAINFVRGIVGLDKTGEQHAQDILAGKFQKPVINESLTTGAPSVPPEEITKPDPNWRVTVQPNEIDNGKEIPSGYVQIDDVTGGVNKWSSSPEKLAAKGIQVPDFSKLPKGQYTYADAVKALKSDSKSASIGKTLFRRSNEVGINFPAFFSEKDIGESYGKNLSQNTLDIKNPASDKDVMDAVNRLDLPKNDENGDRMNAHEYFSTGLMGSPLKDSDIDLLVEELKSEGFDGAKVKDVDVPESWVAFSKNQILEPKSNFSTAKHEDMTPEEKLSAAPKVRVSLPSGATHLRIVHENGSANVIHPAALNREQNPLEGNNIQRVHPVKVSTSGVFNGRTIPVKGAVKVEPQFSVPKNQPEPEKKPIFRDNILDALSSWQAKGTSQQLLAHLAKFRGTKDQADWIGLEDFLNGKTSVTKSEVEDFVRANQVDVREIVKGDKDVELRFNQEETDYGSGEKIYDVVKRSTGRVLYTGGETDSENYITSLDESGEKFSNYQTAGGKNYRELLLTLPAKENQPSVWNVTAPDGRSIKQFNTEAEAKAQVDKSGGSIKPIYLTTKNQKNFTSNHFDEPNILGHIRFNERESTTAENPTPVRTMHLEELQSDFAQKGRKEGFQTPESIAELAAGKTRRIEVEARMSQLIRERQNETGQHQEFASQIANDLYKESPEFKALRDEFDKLPAHHAQPAGVPNMPFKTSWPMLLFKRALRWAADNGFRRITWTTGDQQNERYDLSKQVDGIVVDKKDGKYTIQVKQKGESDWSVVERGIDANRMADAIGKDLAERAVVQTEKEARAKFEGDGLKFGGTGMTCFYDKILPSEVNKFVKRYGAKVGEAEIDATGSPEFGVYKPTSGGARQLVESFDKRSDADAHALKLKSGYGGSYFVDLIPRDMAGQKVHSLDITPELQKAASEGLPMFSVPKKDQTETPEFKRWFGESKVVDKNGGPLVVYHGTAGDFSEFKDKSSPMQEMGFHFGSKNAASARLENTSKAGGSLMPVYLKIENPLKLQDPGIWGGFSDFQESLDKAKVGIEARGKSNDEIIKLIESEGYDGIKYKNDTEGGWSWLAFHPEQIKSAIGNSGAFDPLNPDIRFSVPKEEKRAQVGGIPEVGQVRDTESISDNQAHIRERLFDGTKPVSDENTSAAWQVFDEMTGNNRSQIAGQLKDAFGGSRLLLGLYKGEVWKYARKLAINGDDSLLRAMYDHSEQFETLAGGGASTAGSALRAEAENSNDPVNRALQSAYETERENAANSASGVDRETFTNLLKRLRDLKLTPDEVEKVVKEGKLPDGKTLEEALEELTPESKEAMTLLDKYQRSQTEWLKPDVKKSIIRVIVDAAIGENKLARYDEKDFQDRLSKRLQEATVPKEIADQLAFEVCKDKATREATKTDKAVKADAAFEQNRAQAILDKLQSDQTEVFNQERRSKVTDLVRAFYKNPAASDEVRAQQIAKLENDLLNEAVKPATAKELAREAGQRKLVLEANDRLALEKVTANEAQQTAERELVKFEEKNSGVEWLKEKGKRDLVLQTIADALKSKSPILDDPTPLVNDTKAKLVGLGVDESTAGKLAFETETIRRTQFANSRVRAMENAAKSKSIRSLIESILETPYRAQSDPKWIHETAVRWFESNGLGKDQAEAAARLFQKEFQEAFARASTKVAEAELKNKVAPRTYDDLERMIRAGIFDPDKNWIDQLAIKNGWKKPSRDQMLKLQELEHKLSDPELSPEEVRNIQEQQMHVLRHVGKKEGQTLRALGESFTASLLSGIRTITVQTSPTVMAFRDLPIMALSDPKNAFNFAKAMYNSFKANAVAAFKYAWMKDAYGFHLSELEHGFNEMKRISEETDDVVKSKTAKPAAKAVAYAKKLYALQRFVFRNLNSIDQASMAVTREWKLAYYSASAFKEAGLTNTDISQLIDHIEMLRKNEFEKAIDSGLDVTTAKVRANSRVEDAVWDFVNNKTGRSDLADQVLKATENDVYSTVGRVPKSLSSTDEGFLTRFSGFNHFLQFISKVRGEGGLQNIGTTALIGMINIPFRTTRYFSDFSPYGLLRYGIYKYRLNRGKENFWKQTYGNALQARARLYSALAGTVAMAAGTAWALHSNTADDKAGNDDFGLYITGKGPNNKVLADAWAKRGFKQYAANFVIGGHIVSIPLTRAGEALMMPFILPAALDDYAWKAKEAAAGGHPIKSPISQATASLVGEALYMTGQSGILQTFGQLQQATENGGSLAKAAVKVGVSAASSTVLPFRQLLASASDMLFGSMDSSSISALIANQFPIVGLPFQTPAVNRFGDPLYDRSWYGLVARTGVPIAFQISRNPENERLYTTLVEKGVSPPPLNRSDIESKYGDMTDAQFKQFATVSGQALKQSTTKNLADIQGMSSEDGKKLMMKLAMQANAQAAMAVGVAPQPASGQTASASGGATKQKKAKALKAQKSVRSLYKTPKISLVANKSHKANTRRTGSLYGVQPRHLYNA